MKSTLLYLYFCLGWSVFWNDSMETQTPLNSGIDYLPRLESWILKFQTKRFFSVEAPIKVSTNQDWFKIMFLSSKKIMHWILYLFVYFGRIRHSFLKDWDLFCFGSQNEYLADAVFVSQFAPHFSAGLSALAFIAFARSSCLLFSLTAMMFLRPLDRANSLRASFFFCLAFPLKKSRSGH